MKQEPNNTMAAFAERPLPKHTSPADVFSDPAYADFRESMITMVHALREHYYDALNVILQHRMREVVGRTPTDIEIKEHGERLIGHFVTEYWWDDTLLFVAPAIALQDAE
jgi:hypothetical protein